jgi:hypothetical protein
MIGARRGCVHLGLRLGLLVALLVLLLDLLHLLLAVVLEDVQHVLTVQLHADLRIPACSLTPQCTHSSLELLESGS